MHCLHNTEIKRKRTIANDHSLTCLTKNRYVNTKLQRKWAILIGKSTHKTTKTDSSHSDRRFPGNNHRSRERASVLFTMRKEISLQSRTASAQRLYFVFTISWLCTYTQLIRCKPNSPLPRNVSIKPVSWNPRPTSRIYLSMKPKIRF